MPLLRAAGGLVARNWRDAVAPGVATLGVAGETSRRDQDHHLSPAAAAAVGGGSTEAAYRAAGLGIVWRKGKQLERVRPEGMSRSQYQKITERHRHAHNVRSGQTVGIPKEFYRTYPKELPAWKYKRFQGWAMSGKRGRLGEAALVAGGALGASRLAHRDVQKRANPADLRRWAAGVGLGSAAGGGAAFGTTRDPGGSAQIVGGGLAGQGAYQGAMYGLKHSVAASERAAGLTRSKKDRELKPLKQRHGAFTTQMYRNYPRTLPGATRNRITGWAGRGRIGMATGTGATLLGATIVGRRRHRSDVAKMAPITPTRRPRHANVGKALMVQQDKRTSLPRAAMMGAGLGAVAYGVPRMQTTREFTRRGRPGMPINSDVTRALRQAEALRSAMEHTTAPLGRGVGRGVGKLPKELSTALNRVPRHLRPATATLVGAILTAHAHPVRRTSYQAVNAPPVTGW